MSDLSDSGSSTLSDWALVNSQGELEGSDADSNTSSIEVVEREGVTEEEVGHQDLDSRESSPECIELEQLMKLADTAARETVKTRSGERGEPEELDEGQGATFTPPVSSQHGLHETSSFRPCTDLEEAGACSVPGHDVTEREVPSERETPRDGHVTQASKVSHFARDDHAAGSSDSVLSLSTVSSLSNISRTSRTDSDSESDFVRLEKESSCVSTESEGEEPHSLSPTNIMATSASSVGSGFNFLCSTRVGIPLPSPLHPSLQDTPPPSPPLPQLPAEGELAPQAVLPSARPPQEEDEVISAGEQDINPAVIQHIVPAVERDIVPAVEQDIVPAVERDIIQAVEQDIVQAVERDVIPAAGNRLVAAVEDEMVALQEEDVQGAEEQPEGDGDEEEGAQGAVLEIEEDMAPLDEGDDVVDDGDTESSTEDGDQDDRIESEQSDDAHSAPPDDLEQVDLSVVNDIGDLPVGRGDVERHYIHYHNATLNGRLNTVVLAVLVLALGMGLGHWIGSTREHFSQLEIQLSQMKRLHQVQDDYMECLSRNDELLVDTDAALQSERERHQEAMSNLRDTNHDLQEQLQDAQDQLEQLLAATVPQAPLQRRTPGDFAYDLQYALTLSKMLIVAEEQFQDGLSDWDSESQRQLLQVRETFRRAMEEKEGRQRSQMEDKLQQEVNRERQRNLHLQVLHQELNERVNHLETENADLKVSVGKMRYMAGSQPAQPSASPHKPCPPSAMGHKPLPSLVAEQLPPPPKPLPPPPFAGDGDGEKPWEKQEHQDERRKSKGSQEGEAENLLKMRSTAHGPSPGVHLSEDTRQEAGHDDGVHTQRDKDAKDSGRDEGKEDGGSDDKNKERMGDGDAGEDVEQMMAEKEQGVHGDSDGARSTSSARKDCGRRESPQPIPVDMRLLQRNLTQERQRAAMWRHLYLWERQERQWTNATACLHYLSRTFNVSALLHLVEGWNLTGMGIGVEGLGELNSLISSLAHLHQHLLHSLPALWQDLSAKIHNLHSDFTSYSQQSGQQQGEGQAQREGGDGKGKEDGGKRGDDDNDDEAQDTPRTRWSEGVQKLLNKTRGTLSNVSRHLQQTWHQMKDASRRFWPADNSILGHMAARVKDSVTRLSRKVQGKASHWFRKRSKWTKQADGKDGRATFPQDQHGQDERRDKSEDKRESHDDHAHHQENSHPRKKKNDRETSRHKGDKDDVDKHQHKHSRDKKKTDHSDQPERWHQRKDGKSKRDDHKNLRHEDGDEGRKGHEFDHPGDDSHHKSALDKREDRKLTQGTDHHHHSYDKDGKEYHLHDKHHWKDSRREKDKEEKKYPHEKSHDDDDDDDKRSNNSGSDKARQFSTKAKDHTSHWDKATHKARYKVQKQFHKLFSKVGAMSKKSYHDMDTKDLRGMLEDVGQVLGLYQDNRHMDLPQSGHRWLQCQFAFWVKARRRGVRYTPEEECLQLLAPWQMGFVLELRARMERGECCRVRTFSCEDGGGPEIDPEYYYSYVCMEDDNYHQFSKDCRGDEDDEEEDDDDGLEQKKQKSQASPKGEREGEGDKTQHDLHGSWKAESRKGGATPAPSGQVNHSDDDPHTWYFHWVEGRNDIRSLEHKADWLFERASERRSIREQEHSTDWLFERAAERQANREDQTEAVDDEKDQQQGRHGVNMEGKSHHGDRGHYGDSGHYGDRGHHEGRGHHHAKKDRHIKEGHSRKEGHHKTQGEGHGKHHKHKNKEHHFKRHKKDHRQKYGRTTF